MARNASEPDGGPEPDPKSLLRRAERVVQAAEAVMFRAEESGDDRLVLTAVREARNPLELAMKAHGMLGADAQVVNDNRTVNFFAGWKPEKVRKIRDALVEFEQNALPPADANDNEGLSGGKFDQ